MTPRDLLIGVWPWSLPDETASQGADMVLKAFDVAGYAIVPKAEIARLTALVKQYEDMIEPIGMINQITVSVDHVKRTIILQYEETRIETPIDHPYIQNTTVEREARRALEPKP